MKVSSYFFVLFAILFFSGCKPKETVLSGQVFVVTKGAENIKLGLVEVQLIDKATAIEFVQKRQAMVEAEIASRQSNFLSLKAKKEKAEVAYAEFLTNNPTTVAHYLDLKENRKKFEQDNLDLAQELNSKSSKIKSARVKSDKATQAYMMTKGLSWEEALPYQKAATDAVTELDELNREMGDFLKSAEPRSKDNDSKINALKVEMAPIEAEAEKMEKPLRDELASIESKFDSANAIASEPYPKSETYLTDFLPAVIQKNTTDADGKFEFSYPQKANFSLYAKAERVVGNKTEKYFWLVNAPSGIEKARVFLSNDNLIYSDPDGYFTIKPQTEARAEAVSQN